MFTFSYFRKNPGFLAGTFKSAKSTIKRFALLNFDLRHLYPSLPIRLMGCYCTLINYKLHWPICQFIFFRGLCALAPFGRKRFLRLMGPSGPKVLRFDSACGAEGCGSRFAANKKRGTPDGAGWGRLTTGCVEGLCSLTLRGRYRQWTTPLALKVQRVQRVQKVQRGRWRLCRSL